MGTPGDTATSPWLTLSGRESHDTLGRQWGDSTPARGASWPREDEPPVWLVRLLSVPRGVLVRVGVQGRAGRGGASVHRQVRSRPASSAQWAATASAQPLGKTQSAWSCWLHVTCRWLSGGDSQVRAPGEPRLSRDDQLRGQLRGALISCPGHSPSLALWGPPAPTPDITLALRASPSTHCLLL